MYSASALRRTNSSYSSCVDSPLFMAVMFSKNQNRKFIDKTVGKEKVFGLHPMVAILRKSRKSARNRNRRNAKQIKRENVDERSFLFRAVREDEKSEKEKRKSSFALDGRQIWLEEKKICERHYRREANR